MRCRNVDILSNFHCRNDYLLPQKRRAKEFTYYTDVIFTPSNTKYTYCFKKLYILKTNYIYCEINVKANNAHVVIFFTKENFKIQILKV